MSASATSEFKSQRPRSARRTRILRRASAFFVIASGAVALHILDDNFLQPEPGTSARDHLASGLIPVAILAALAVAYPHLRAGLRATTAMTLGALAITVGVPSGLLLPRRQRFR